MAQYEAMGIDLYRVAIWQPILADGLNVKMNNPSGWLNIADGRIALLQSPVYRYIKNYQVGDIKYSLLVNTEELKEEEVEKELDKVAKKLEKDRRVVIEALAHPLHYFVYTNNYIKETK